MNPWTKADFTAEAKKIAEAFVAGEDQNGASMTDLLVKSAQTNQLNPEQITRLTRMANTLAFNAKFAAKAVDPDRHVEFPIGKEAEVIQRLGPAQGACKIAAELYPDLPDEFAAGRGEVAPPEPAMTVEKVAHDLREALGPENPSKLHEHWTKVASELESKQASFAARWETEMLRLTEFAKTSGVDADDFEKDAVALHGGHVVPELGQLRTNFGLEPVSYTSEKCAEIREFVEGRVSTGTSAVKAAADARIEYVNHGRALVKARGYVKHFAGLIRG